MRLCVLGKRGGNSHVSRVGVQSARKLNRDIGDAADELDEIRNREARFCFLVVALATLTRIPFDVARVC